MNPINPVTKSLWAESKILLPLAIALSKPDTFSCAALLWAARNRSTLSSGVSVNRASWPLASAGFAALPLRGNRGSAGLELAWGVAAVKRVASETLRGAAFIGIGEKGSVTGSVRGCCRVEGGDVFGVEGEEM